MKTLDLVQGSQEWLDARFKHPCASEAPVMMGASTKATRNELLHIKATGDEKVFSDWVQKNLFDKGHEYEAMARPIAEDMIGDELYPVTATDDDGYLLASFDGITIMENVTFENKMWNERLAECVHNKDLPPEYYWQLEQQLLVSHAEYCLFAVSNVTKNNFVSMEYYPVPGRAEQLLAGWKRFDEDVKNYQPVETKVVPVGVAPSKLPALHIMVKGEVTESNLTEYKEYAVSVFSAINKDLTTDEDFANAKSTIKWCKEIEDNIKAAKQHALGQTGSIDRLFKDLDSVDEIARKHRLDQEKLVKIRENAIRVEKLNVGKKSLSDHISTINSTLGKLSLPNIPVDFAAAMKGKRTVVTLQSAVDDELARAKIEASRIGDSIRVNILELQVLAKGYEFLFVDAQQLVLKDHDDLTNLIAARIAAHKKIEEEKKAAEDARLLEEKKAAEDARLLEEQQAAEDARLLEEQQAAEELKALDSNGKTEPHPITDFVPQNNTGYGAAAAKESPKKQHRRVAIIIPKDAEIIKLVATHYNVTKIVAIDWIRNIDFDKHIIT